MPPHFFRFYARVRVFSTARQLYFPHTTIRQLHDYRTRVDPRTVVTVNRTSTALDGLKRILPNVHRTPTALVGLKRFL